MKAVPLSILLVLCLGYPLTAHLQKAIGLYEAGAFKQAVDLLEQMSRSSPEDPEIRLWLGKSYLKIREWDKAVREMEEAVRLQPINALYHLWLGRACGMRASHSVFLTAIRWAKRVVKEFETANRLAPENLDIRFDLLDFYLHAPSVVGGGKDKAEAQAKQIAKLDPKKGHVARAAIFEKEKNWDMVQKELTEAVLKYPDDPDAHKDLAQFLLGRKDYAGAAEYAQRALVLDSESKRARLIQAAAKVRLNIDIEEAMKILQELAAGPLRDEDPTFEEVYSWLGECHLALGDKAKARAAFSTALKFNPEFEPAKTAMSKLRQQPTK